MSTREDVILRELRTMVDFALWTPLQDERVASAPLEAVTKLLEEVAADAKVAENAARDRRNWAEAVLSVVAPLLEKAAPPSALARVLARLTQQHPRSQLVHMLRPAITRCLKHTVDFSKSPDMRKLLQVGKFLPARGGSAMFTNVPSGKPGNGLSDLTSIDDQIFDVTPL